MLSGHRTYIPVGSLRQLLKKTTEWRVIHGGWRVSIMYFPVRRRVGWGTMASFVGLKGGSVQLKVKAHIKRAAERGMLVP